MNIFEIQGKVHTVKDAKSYGNKGFRKQEVWLVQVGANYDNYIPISLTGDAIESCPSVGSEIVVEVSLSGRIWEPKDGRENRCFVDLMVQSITVLSEPEPAQSKETLTDNDIPF